MISNGKDVKFAGFVLLVVSEETIMRFCFGDIQNNQGPRKGNQPQPSA